MPFTRDQFLDVFGAYNTTLWPAVVALWVLSLIAVAATAARPRRAADRRFSLFLALLWAWSAIAYHAVYFTRINPAAWLFAALFLAQAGLFLWLGAVRGTFRMPANLAPRHLAAGALIAYAFAYPFVVMADGFAPPRAPTFGVPCPTVILTIGLLMLAERPPLTLAIVPVLWAVVASSAAFQFGVHADLVLPLSILLFTADRIASRRRRLHQAALT